MLVVATFAVSACSDVSPVTPGAPDPLHDMSNVVIDRGDGTVPDHGPGLRGSQPTTSAICFPDPDPCPPREKPLADFDYGPDYFGYSSGGTKYVHIAAWSDNYANIDNMILTAHFKSVGGQGPQGCNATPAQFDQETVSGFGTPWGNHYSIWAERNLTYPATETWVWGVNGDHTFDASAGYSVDGYANVGTFYSSGKLCT
jgi:hypothetical protein